MINRLSRPERNKVSLPLFFSLFLFLLRLNSNCAVSCWLSHAAAYVSSTVTNNGGNGRSFPWQVPARCMKIYVIFFYCTHYFSAALAERHAVQNEYETYYTCTLAIRFTSAHCRCTSVVACTVTLHCLVSTSNEMIYTRHDETRSSVIELLFSLRENMHLVHWKFFRLDDVRQNSREKGKRRERQGSQLETWKLLVFETWNSWKGEEKYRAWGKKSAPLTLAPPWLQFASGLSHFPANRMPTVCRWSRQQVNPSKGALYNKPDGHSSDALRRHGWSTVRQHSATVA